MKGTNNISDVIAPMFAITAELDVIIAALLRDTFAMSLADFKILRAIHMLGACSQLDVARLNHVTEAAVSKRIKSLSENDLIEKTTDPADARATVLSLTTNGKALMKQLQKEVINNTELVLRDLSPSDRNEMQTLLLKILKMVVSHSPRKDMLVQSKHPILERIKNSNSKNN